MRIEVQFWGVLRRLAGADHRSVDMPSGATVAQLAEALAVDAALAAELERCAFARGATLVPRSGPLEDGDQIAVLPPVSGG